MGKRARTSNMIAHTQYLYIFSAGVYPVPLYKSFQFPIPFYRIHIHLQNWPLATNSESLFSFFCYVPSIVNYCYSAQCLYTPTEERNVVWTYERSHRWKLIINICIEWNEYKIISMYFQSTRLGHCYDYIVCQPIERMEEFFRSVIVCMLTLVNYTRAREIQLFICWTSWALGTAGHHVVLHCISTVIRIMKYIKAEN